jgi:signal transduction histidine kinase
MEAAGSSMEEPPRTRTHRRLLLVTAIVTVGLSAVSAAIALEGRAGQSELVAFVRATMVGVPMAVGLYAWHRRPAERFGPLLIAAGCMWFVTTLAESGDEVLYSTGRVAGWVVEVALIYLVLSFPSGRIRERSDRLLVTAGALILTVLYLPTAFLAESFPVPAPYTSCTDDCPSNAFLVRGSESGLVDVVRPVREVLTVLLFGAVAVRLTQRVRMASPPLRRTLSPLLAVAIVRTAILALALTARIAEPSSQIVTVGVWILAIAVPAMALAFLVGLLRWKLFVARALQMLGVRLHAQPDIAEMRDVFAEAFDDPSAEIVIPRGEGREGWVDSAGRPLRLPEPSEARYVTIVEDRGVVTAAIICDGALRDQPALVRAASAHVALALENRRLAAKVEASVRELRETRARILHDADRVRLEIERDLHDGAQQRLVALHIELNVAEERIRHDPEVGPEILRELSREVDEALENIRSLARGIYPSLLADRGLAEALRTAALRSSISTTITPTDIGRFSPQVETAVYFCILEALQNAAKHAEGARHVVVSLRNDEALHFEVRDDGPGFDVDRIRPGAGLTNMRDRMASVGGELQIDSVPGEGTTLSGTVPLA